MASGGDRMLSDSSQNQDSYTRHSNSGSRFTRSRAPRHQRGPGGGRTGFARDIAGFTSVTDGRGFCSWEWPALPQNSFALPKSLSVIPGKHTLDPLLVLENVP